jgi:hypothetical protein
MHIWGMLLSPRCFFLCDWFHFLQQHKIAYISRDVYDLFFDFSLEFHSRALQSMLPSAPFANNNVNTRAGNPFMVFKHYDFQGSGKKSKLKLIICLAAWPTLIDDFVHFILHSIQQQEHDVGVQDQKMS